MSANAKKVLKRIDEYIAYMAASGKEPTQITITEQQKEIVLLARKKAKDKEPFDKYKGYPVSTV